MTRRPFASCPGCAAVPTYVRGEWETVHDDDCDWFHDRPDQEDADP